MWDCTLTSPHMRHELGGPSTPGPVSVDMSPRGRRRPKGESCWGHYLAWTTPREMEESPLRHYDDARAFKLVCGKFACKICDDDVLRSIEGMNIHMRTAHDKLEVYSSFSSSAPESASGGRTNANVLPGRNAHRAKLIRNLKNLGVTAGELHAEGYTLPELRSAQFSLKELMGMRRYSLEQLQRAGVTQGLKGAGFPIKALSEAGYNLTEMRKGGYSCSALKSGLGSSLAELRAAGFSLHELKCAGFVLPELKALTRPGSSDPAFTVQDLIKEGYGCKEMKAAGFKLAALRSGYTEADLNVTHFTTKAELKDDGFSLQQLKLAGFSAQELKHEGFSPKDLVSAGFSRTQLKEFKLTA